jgi:hypothetical protein
VSAPTHPSSNPRDLSTLIALLRSSNQGLCLDAANEIDRLLRDNVDLMKACTARMYSTHEPSDVSEYFHKLRHDPAHHLGLGDIRLTVAQQEEIARAVQPPSAAPMKMHVDYEWQSQRLERDGPEEECAAGGPPCASCESVSQIAADTGQENLRVMDERDRYKQALYQANGRLMQLGLDPVKLDYSGSTKSAE